MTATLIVPQGAAATVEVEVVVVVDVLVEVDVEVDVDVDVVVDVLVVVVVVDEVGVVLPPQLLTSIMNAITKINGMASHFFMFSSS